MAIGAGVDTPDEGGGFESRDAGPRGREAERCCDAGPEVGVVALVGRSADFAADLTGIAEMRGGTSYPGGASHTASLI